jgi:hypothetical protein
MVGRAQDRRLQAAPRDAAAGDEMIGPKLQGVGIETV